MIVDFLSERIYDQQSVEGIFKGLISLLQIDRVSNDAMIKIPERIFSELNVQSFPQTVRFSILKTFELIMDKNIKGASWFSRSCD